MVACLFAVIWSLLSSASSRAASWPMQVMEPEFESITELDGESLLRVNTLIQDRSGFIWLATDNGLMKFDGFKIHKFVHQPGNRQFLAP